MGYHGRHVRTKRLHRGIMLSAVAVAMLIPAAVWLPGRPPISDAEAGTVAAGSGSDVHAAAAVATDHPSDPTTDSQTQDPGAAVTAALRQCHGVYARQALVLDAARRSLQQWRVHVTAMNQLVAGKISLQQARQFWERTRVGAANRVAAFTTHYHGYVADHRGCEAASDVAASDPELAACADSVAARDRAITAAHTAVSTWADHIVAMDQLRSGKLSPERAMKMWIASWHEGVRQLDVYHRRVEQAQKTGVLCEGFWTASRSVSLS